MSLYLKYRPQKLEDVIGQGSIVTTLKNAIRHGTLTHAYLFSGPRGTGKTSFAHILAKSINCQSLSMGYEPCNQCEMCQAILNSRLVDLIEIDAASNRGIDEIRELREKIVFAPTHGKAKVYIIDEVHMLTKEAFNALLKTLEEPPAHAFFILATTEPHKIPETILSRCQHFSFKRIGAEDIVGRLGHIVCEEKIQAEPQALALIAQLSNGGLRDAIGLLEQMNLDGKVQYDAMLKHLGITGTILIEAFYQALLAQDAGRALDLIAQVNRQGQNLNQFCRELISFFREQMLLGVSEKKNVDMILAWIDIFNQARLSINQADIPQLPLETAAIKACGYEFGKETKAVQKKAEAPAKAANTEDIFSSVTLDAVKQHWQKIADQIETPFIRMSFLDGEPTQLEKDRLHMAFRSQSLMEKVQDPVHQAEIHKAIKTVMNSKFILVIELRKINLKPAKEYIPKTDESLADMAREVFGS